jgi:hypothetical protein
VPDDHHGNAPRAMQVARTFYHANSELAGFETTSYRFVFGQTPSLTA